MKLLPALQAGLAGAGALTVIHQYLQKTDEDAPRMDLLGMNALAKLLNKPFEEIKHDEDAYNLTLLGDLVLNSLYYSLVSIGKRKSTFFRGTLLGLLAGAGAVILPKYLNLNPAYSNRTTITKAETIGLYLIAGIIASAEYTSSTDKKSIRKSNRR
ncbi:MAG: hypothetical protein ACTHJ5_09610 [Ilyomonas sp.]